VSRHHVILSLSKDGRATHGYLMPILRQAQDDTVAAHDDTKSCAAIEEILRGDRRNLARRSKSCAAIEVVRGDRVVRGD